MLPEKAKFSALCFKVFNVVTGIVVVVVGLYSYFQSAWKEIADPVYVKIENFYISTVIITFILSLVVLAATYSMDMGSGLLRKIDLVYHVGASVFILVAAAGYIYSAKRSEKLQNERPARVTWPTDKDLLIPEKLVAGILSIAQCILYGITTFFIYWSQMISKVYSINYKY